MQFSKNTNFSKCSECIVLKAQMKTTTTKELEEKERARLKKHNKIVMCGRYCYYADRIMSEQYPKEHLSIIHDKMEKHRLQSQDYVSNQNLLQEQTWVCH